MIHISSNWCEKLFIKVVGQQWLYHLPSFFRSLLSIEVYYSSKVVVPGYQTASLLAEAAIPPTGRVGFYLSPVRARLAGEQASSLHSTGTQTAFSQSS